MNKDELKRILDDHNQWLLSIGVYGKQGNLQNTDLRGVDLQGVNLGGVMNLTVDQLCEATTLYKTQLDPELAKQVKEKCPELLDPPK